MEFKFDVSEIFPSPVVEVNQNLIPPGFCGDRRGLSNVVTKVADVINTMGNASAAAQGLSNPITTAERLRKADQIVYLLVDRSAKGGKGVITGMLKTGKKSLYIFDRDGQHYHVSPPCVLDFYIHESRQRQGLGKQLFEHMLQKEQVEPSKLAIDRPSEKLLSFMNKHYGLENAMRQMNNYVVFDGFFPEPINADITRDGNSPAFTKEPANGLQSFTSYGRYGAGRPPCSMGEIIHNQSTIQSNEPTGNMQANPQTTNVTQSQPIMASGQQPYSDQMQGNMVQSAPPANWYLQQQPSPYYQQPNIYQQYPPQEIYSPPIYQTQQQNPFPGNQYLSPPPTPYNGQIPTTTLSAPIIYNNLPYITQPNQIRSEQFIQAPPQYSQQYQNNVPPQNNYLNPNVALMQPPQNQLVQMQSTPQQVMQPQRAMTTQHVMPTHQSMMPQQNVPLAFAQDPNLAQHQSLPIIPNQQHVVLPAQSLPTLPNQTIQQHHRQPPQLFSHSDTDNLFNDGYPPQRPPNPPVTLSEQQPAYKYYDSTKQAMQTEYKNAYGTGTPASGLNQNHIPNATGDMQAQVRAEAYQQTATMKQPMLQAQPISNPIQMQGGDYQPQVNVNPNQDQSGQMFGQNVLQSQLVSRPQIASQ